MTRLKAERLRRGWRQKDLAEQAGLSPADVCRIELGRFVPYPVYARKLETVFGLPIAELLEDVQVDPCEVSLRGRR